MTQELKRDQVILVHQAVLGGWFCVHKDLPEDEALDKIVDILRNGNTILEMPVEDKELVRDRLFGGWKCLEDDDRRHVYYALAHYTFLHRECNTAMSKRERRRVWAEMVKENKGNKCPCIGDGPFVDIKIREV